MKALGLLISTFWLTGIFASLWKWGPWLMSADRLYWTASGFMVLFVACYKLSTENPSLGESAGGEALYADNSATSRIADLAEEISEFVIAILVPLAFFLPKERQKQLMQGKWSGAIRIFAAPPAVLFLIPLIVGSIENLHGTSEMERQSLEDALLSKCESLYLPNELVFWREMLRLREASDEVRTTMFRANGPYELPAESKQITTADLILRSPDHIKDKVERDRVLELRREWYEGVVVWLKEEPGRSFQRVLSRSVDHRLFDLLQLMGTGLEAGEYLNRVAASSWPGESINVTIFDKEHIIFTIASGGADATFELKGIRLTNEAFALYLANRYWHPIFEAGEAHPGR
jgi:hypothetical protein